jgi:hypothetical protein
MYYGASSLYLSVLNFAEQLLTETPARDRPTIDRAIRRTIHDWGPSFIGGPRPLIFSGDAPLETSVPLIQVAEQVPGRYYSMQDIVSGVETVGTHLATARDTIRHYRDRIMGNTPVDPPQFERRPSEERAAMGNKRTRRRKKRKRRRKKRHETRRK